MRKWIFAIACAAMAGVSSAQVIFHPPVSREFVDHPYNPRLTSDQVDRLRSLEEGLQRWDDPAIYIDPTTGRQVWAVERDTPDYGQRTWMTDQPLYFRKADLLPEESAPEADGAEMIDVRDLAEPAASAGTIEIKPWRGKPSDNADRVSD